jgi:multisubunit Na+/H+ antiporter MnhG subunit
MNPPLPEPLYVTSFEEIIWGGTLIAITMAMHGFGMLAVLRVDFALKNWMATKKSLIAGLFPVILASWMIMLVHLTEVIVWAAFFLWKGAFPNHSIAYYFSLNEYTTVGSNFNLPLRWRLLEGMIATAGLLTFAWSTGILLTLAQEFQDQRMQVLKQRQKTPPKPTPAPDHAPDKPNQG